MDIQAIIKKNVTAGRGYLTKESDKHLHRGSDLQVALGDAGLARPSFSNVEDRPYVVVDKVKLYELRLATGVNPLNPFRYDAINMLADHVRLTQGPQAALDAMFETAKIEAANRRALKDSFYEDLTQVTPRISLRDNDYQTTSKTETEYFAKFPKLTKEEKPRFRLDSDGKLTGRERFSSLGRHGSLERLGSIYETEPTEIKDLSDFYSPQIHSNKKFEDIIIYKLEEPEPKDSGVKFTLGPDGKLVPIAIDGRNPFDLTGRRFDDFSQPFGNRFTSSFEIRDLRTPLGMEKYLSQESLPETMPNPEDEPFTIRANPEDIVFRGTLRESLEAGHDLPPFIDLDATNQASEETIDLHTYREPRRNLEYDLGQMPSQFIEDEELKPEPYITWEELRKKFKD